MEEIPFDVGQVVYYFIPGGLMMVAMAFRVQRY